MLFKYNGFIDLIKTDIKKIKNKSYVENKVDNCIKYLIINNKQKQLSEKKYKDLMSKYVTDGISCFEYSEFVFDSTISRPYMLNWSRKEYKKIIKNEITIYIKIDIEQLMNNVEKMGIQIIKEKENYTQNPYLFIYKNKKYTFIIDGEEFIVGKMFVYQIAAMFYTSKEAIDYFLEVTDDILKVIKVI